MFSCRQKKKKILSPLDFRFKLNDFSFVLSCFCGSLPSNNKNIVVYFNENEKEKRKMTNNHHTICKKTLFSYVLFLLFFYCLHLFFKPSGAWRSIVFCLLVNASFFLPFFQLLLKNKWLVAVGILPEYSIPFYYPV